jgi:hypothetical protein
MTAQSASANVNVGIEQGGNRLFVRNGGVLDIEAGGTLSFGGVPLKIARGEIALDGANPTPVATGLTTIITAVAVLKKTTVVSAGTAFVTVDFTGADGNLNLYGWILAGSASAGTETVEWIAFGT